MIVEALIICFDPFYALKNGNVRCISNVSANASPNLWYHKAPGINKMTLILP
jgi:hypothetical protein